MKIGLFFGSFNPVHTGHMIIANHMATRTELDQVWLVVSPHNPLKLKKSLANDYDRLHLVELAIKGNPVLRSSNIEFSLPQPSYTVDTLAYMVDKYPDHEFALIMGGDNLASLHKWKNYEVILENYGIYVYSRPGSETPSHINMDKIHVAEAPMIHISASYIRRSIRKGYSVRYLVPESVHHYLENSAMYRD
ncbi:MAG TPA: nicotinate (nicotinamide) nucleotide adenylyltransferase [Saprospiraceae bacterium]|nr:nicotinate (nicotinamide) nucleotide adenylyltransferase [Saprospiraceae bacterium]